MVTGLNRDRAKRLDEARLPAKGPFIAHWVLEGHGIAAELIQDEQTLKMAWQQLLDRLELHVVNWLSHYFGPGLSMVAILSESHAALHSWPELGYLHADLVTCKPNPRLNEQQLKEAFWLSFASPHVQIRQVPYPPR